MTHTPTPWKTEQMTKMSNGKLFNTIIAEDDGFSRRVIADTPFTDKFNDHQANAQHIVKCVNLHNELVEACKAVLNKLDNMTTKEFEEGYEQSEREALRQALTKAEEA